MQRLRSTVSGAFAAPRHLITALLGHFSSFVRCFWGTFTAPRLRTAALLQHRFWGAFAAPRHLITALCSTVSGHFYSTSSSYNSAVCSGALLQHPIIF